MLEDLKQLQPAVGRSVMLTEILLSNPFPYQYNEIALVFIDYV